MITLGIIEPLAIILAIVSLPYAPVAARVPLLALAAFCAASSLHLSKPVTDDWVAQSVPAGLRSRFVGWRARLMCLVTIAAMLSIGKAISAVGPTNTTGLGIILLIGAAFGVMAAMPLRYASMPEASARSQVRLADLIEVVRDKPFMRFIVGIYGPLIPFFFVLPYYAAYQLKIIGIDAEHMALITVIYLVLKIGLLKIAERLLPFMGPRRMFLACVPIYVAFFFLHGMAQHVDADASRTFSMTSPYWRGVWPLAAAWWLASIGDSLWNVAQGTALYGIVPTTPNRPAYFAAFNLMSFLSYSVMPLISWAALQVLGDASVSFMGLKFDHFQLFFLICSGLMAFTSLTLLRIPNSRDEVIGQTPREFPAAKAA
jgi:hypothetical protein